MNKISDLFDIVKGTVQSSKNTAGNYNFITASEEWKTHNTYSHDCEALIFAMGASGSLGRTHYVNGKFISSDLCFILTPKEDLKEKLNLKFYYFYFNTFRDKIVKKLATGTSKLAINLKGFSSYEIHLIDVERQNEMLKKIESIKNVSDNIFTEISNQENYIKSLRQSILQQAIEGKLIEQDENDEPASVILEKIKAEKEKLIAEKKIKKQKELPPITEEEKPFELPQGWEWCRLGDILTHNEYGTSEKANATYSNFTIPVLRMNNILPNGTMNYMDLKYVSNTIKEISSLILKRNDLIFNRTNSYELVGKTGVFNEEGIYTFASYLIRLRPLLVNSLFVHRCMNSNYYRKTQIEPYIVQQNGQANYNGTKVRNTLIPLPPLAEQQRIVEKVDRLMVLCDELEQEVTNAKKYASQLMEAVLQEAFAVPNEKVDTGKVIEFVPKPNKTDIEEEVLMAARGKIKEDTMKNLLNRAKVLVNEEV